MEIILSPEALEDLHYWQQTNNHKGLQRIRQLLEAIQSVPFQGIGKPEQLRFQLSGLWSRRINREHRIIYEVRDAKIVVHALKEHYV
jgi:toxin YoeB